MERVFSFTINGARAVLRTTASAREVIRNARRVWGNIPTSFEIVPNHMVPTLFGFDAYDHAARFAPVPDTPDEVQAKKRQQAEEDAMVIEPW